MGNKKEVLENQAEKAFFEEIKKVFKKEGEVLVASFNNHVIPEEIRLVPGHQNETKAIAPLSSFSDKGMMELSYIKDPKPPKQDLATLTVLSSSEEGCLEKLDPDFRFIIIVPKEKESKSKIRFVDFRSNRQEIYDLSDNSYDRHLVEDIFVGIVQSLMAGRE